MPCLSVAADKKKHLAQILALYEIILLSDRTNTLVRIPTILKDHFTNSIKA